MPDDFEFKDEKEEKGVEASLDDFFQPAEQETTAKKAAKPAAKAAKKEENQLPIEKSRVAGLPEEPEAEAFPKSLRAGEPKPEEPGEKKPKVRKIKKEKAPGDSSRKNLPIVIGVVVVGIVVLAAAGYYAYNKFLNPSVEINKPSAMNLKMPPKHPKPPAPVVEVGKTGTGTEAPVASAVPLENKGKPGPKGKKQPGAAPAVVPPAAKPPVAAPKPAGTTTTTPPKTKATASALKTSLAPAPVTKGPVTKPGATPPAPVTTAAKPTPVPVASAPATGANKKLPVPAAKQPAPQPLQPAAVKPSTPAPAATAKPQHIKVKPVTLAKPGAKPALAAPASAKSFAPAPPVNLPTRAPGSGWACQVGAYMLWESFDTPLAGVRGAGYNNLYYLDRDKNFTVYTLSLKGQFDQATANAKAQSLVGIGFRPHLEPAGTQYRVVVYKYGKKFIAEQSRSKIKQAKLGPCEITSQRQNVTLHQLRIGTYANSKRCSQGPADPESERICSGTGLGEIDGAARTYGVHRAAGLA